MACQPVIHRFIENALGDRLRWMNHGLARLLGDVQAAGAADDVAGARAVVQVRGAVVTHRKIEEDDGRPSVCGHHARAANRD
jgi:hypothetical protein